MTRILVADDHPVVRAGLVQVLSDAMGLEVVAEASTGSEVLDIVRKTKLDVVLLDMNMPDRSGLDTLKQIKAEFPSLPVLVLSMFDEKQYAVRVLKAGGAGYLTKGSEPSALVEAIRKAASGQKVVTPETATALLSLLDGDSSKLPHETLSDREFQVLKKLAAGDTVSQIAETLALSVKTVSTYRSRVLEKMEMKSNAELARYALEHDLIV